MNYYLHWNYISEGSVSHINGGVGSRQVQLKLSVFLQPKSESVGRLLGAFYKSDQFINCAAQIINS